MNLKWTKIYLILVMAAIFFLVGCNSGNIPTAYDQINPSSKLYKKNSFPNNKVKMARAEQTYSTDDGSVRFYVVDGGIFLCTLDFQTAFELPDGLAVENILKIMAANVGDAVVFILLTKNSNKVFVLSDSIRPYPPDIRRIFTNLPSVDVASNASRIHNRAAAFIIVDPSNIYLYNPDTGSLNNIYTAEAGYTINGVHWNEARTRFEVSLYNPKMPGQILYLWFDSDGRYIGENVDYLQGFPGANLVSTSIMYSFFDFFYSKIQVTLQWLSLATSDVKQIINICPSDQSGPCKSTEVDSEIPIAEVVSNGDYVATSNSAITLALTGDGAVFKWDDNKFQWEFQSSLGMNIGSNSSFYSAFNSMFYVIGTSTISNNIGDSIIRVSQDGKFWEDTNIHKFSIITATPNSYCGIENDPSDPLGLGHVSCWGNNTFNKLGLGDSESYTPARALIPAPIGLAQGDVSSISYLSLAGGNSHVCGLRSDTKAIDCWGLADSGQLADGIVHPSGYSTPTPTPMQIPSKLELPIKAIAAGGAHTCVLDNLNNIWCAGDNESGQVDATSLQQAFPRLVIANYNVPKRYRYNGIAAGDNFTCGVTTDESGVYCWGEDYSSSSNPIKQITLPSADFSNFTGTISASGKTVCVLSNNIHSSKTNAWCWGDNKYGQLGDGESGAPTYTPQQVISNVGPLKFVRLSQSAVNTCGVTDKGFVYCWGDNTYLQTGLSESGPILNPQSPIQLNGFPGNFLNVSTGLYSTCLVSNEINVTGVIHNTYCLGDNSEGQLGISSLNNESQPTLVNINLLNPINGG